MNSYKIKKRIETELRQAAAGCVARESDCRNSPINDLEIVRNIQTVVYMSCWSIIMARGYTLK